MAEEAKNRSVPVAEGLFTWRSDNPQLIVTKCHSCGSYYFPKRRSCPNPNCKEKKIEDVLLSTAGKLWSYTSQNIPPAMSFKIDQKPPFMYGLVEFPEGIRILGLIAGAKLEELKIGMDMKLVVEAFSHNEEGQEIVTWKFRPD